MNRYYNSSWTAFYDLFITVMFNTHLMITLWILLVKALTSPFTAFVYS
jgi:hypothetical protein